MRTELEKRIDDNIEVAKEKVKKYHRKTWCELSEKETERRNPEGNTPKCKNHRCFDCYGDTSY